MLKFNFPVLVIEFTFLEVLHPIAFPCVKWMELLFEKYKKNFVFQTNFRFGISALDYVVEVSTGPKFPALPGPQKFFSARPGPQSMYYKIFTVQFF